MIATQNLNYYPHGLSRLEKIEMPLGSRFPQIWTHWKASLRQEEASRPVDFTAKVNGCCAKIASLPKKTVSLFLEH
jgi:hypothetical protein